MLFTQPIKVVFRKQYGVRSNRLLVVDGIESIVCMHSDFLIASKSMIEQSLTFLFVH